MRLRLGPGDTAIEQPGAPLLVAFEPQPGREQPLPGEADLVLNLALLPPRPRGACHRLDQVVRAHLPEAAVVGALFANKDRIHGGLHVVVDPARTGAPEEGERPVVDALHHLLALARIRPHQRHPAVAEPDVVDACVDPSRWSSRHRAGRSRGSSRTGRPRRAQTQRHEGRSRRRILPPPPPRRRPPHRVPPIAAGGAGGQAPSPA
jgi:hypothetical protein